ncbi:MAG: hypothetical protein MZV63_58865 [Marinilabiliales bacterium]|nr:hypothetical protein [Marinilabiliales bacterium]
MGGIRQERVLVAGPEHDLVAGGQEGFVAPRHPCLRLRRPLAGDIQIDLAVAAAKGLLLAEIPSVDPRVAVLQAGLAGQKDQLLGAVAVVVLVDDDLDAHVLEVAETEIGHFHGLPFVPGDRDPGLVQQGEGLGFGLLDDPRFHGRSGAIITHDDCLYNRGRLCYIMKLCSGGQCEIRVFHKRTPDAPRTVPSARGAPGLRVLRRGSSRAEAAAFGRPQGLARRRGRLYHLRDGKDRLLEAPDRPGTGAFHRGLLEAEGPHARDRRERVQDGALPPDRPCQPRPRAGNLASRLENGPRAHLYHPRRTAGHREVRGQVFDLRHGGLVLPGQDGPRTASGVLRGLFQVRRIRRVPAL